MLVIHKYSLPAAETKLSLPLGATPLSFGFQKGVPVLWCLINNEEKTVEDRTFRGFETGELIDKSLKSFIGTISDEGIIHHLFEIENESR